MNKSSSSDDWLQAELADALDEDLELELSEPALSEEIRKIYKDSHPPTIERAHSDQKPVEQTMMANNSTGSAA